MNVSWQWTKLLQDNKSVAVTKSFFSVVIMFWHHRCPDDTEPSKGNVSAVDRSSLSSEFSARNAVTVQTKRSVIIESSAPQEHSVLI